jgi:hypothetical protein
MSGTGVTQINKAYLQGLATQLGDVKTQVENQLSGLGPGPSSAQTATIIGAIDSNLSVHAGTTAFAIGTTLNTDLGKMGGSVNEQLTWLDKILTDMIQELQTTADKMSNTETLNEEQAANLITDFQGVIGDINTPPSSTPSTTPPS